MDFTELKRDCRLRVHENFTRPASYESPDGSAALDVTVRLHTSPQIFGDLDREGYGKRVEDINAVVFLLSEVQPAVRGVVTFTGSGISYVIKELAPPEDELTQIAFVNRRPK